MRRDRCLNYRWEPLTPADVSGNSGATTGHEIGPAAHVRVSTMRRQITLKILRQIIFEMTLPCPGPVDSRLIF